MLDIQLIRQDPDAIAAALAKRGTVVDFAEFLGQDAAYRALLTEVQEKKALRNKVSSQVGAMKAKGEDTEPVFAQMRALGDEIAAADANAAAINEQMQNFLLALPNLPDADVVAGDKEQNRAVSTFGTVPAFDFESQNHVDLATSLALIDYPRGAKLGGAGSWAYTGMGARLELALVQFFLDTHIADGWQLILPPHMLSWENGLTAGQFPKFGEDVYWLNTEQGNGSGSFFLLPTAETALVNYHRAEILEATDLPLRYTAYTPCYRREAGSYRQDERGMIRGHQFNKVEMVMYTTAEQSDAAFDELVGRAKKLMEMLGLHHQVVALAAGDISHGMARTVDIEVYLPSMKGYKEVASISNARDYQARRGNIRVRGADGKLTFAHTLNGSGLATSRIFPAILEQYQTPEGGVTVPEVLRCYMGGLETIAPQE